MAFSKVQANWSNVSHANTTITRVSQVSVSQGGSLVEYAGDTDVYPIILAHLMSKPTMSITSADIGLMMSIAPGTTGPATATHKDVRYNNMPPAVTGDITYMLVNATAENVDSSGSFGAVGTSTLRLRAYSVDGQTNPLSFTQTRS